MLVDARVPGAVATGYGLRIKTARTISIEDGCRLRDDIEGTSRGKESRGEPRERNERLRVEMHFDLVNETFNCIYQLCTRTTCLILEGVSVGSSTEEVG